MKITTTARHFETSPELIEHIEERMRRLKRYFDHILHIDVIMSVEKFRHIAEVNMHVNNHDFTAKEVSEDMFNSVDLAARNLERQIKKYKGKLILNRQHPRRAGRTVSSPETVVKAESVGSAAGIDVLEQVVHEIAELSVEEAIIAMEEQNRDFLLFNNPESGKLSFVYKRSDGHFGVIDSLE